VGIAVLLAIAFLVLGLISDLVIPLVFAAILAAIFVPLVDRLERWRVPRWLGAPLVVLLVIGVVSVIVWLVVAGLGSVTVLIVGIVTGLFILLFLMKDWRLVTDGTANQVAALLGLPDRVGRQIVADTVHSFRGYALGLTIVGLMNGAVVGLGALLLGVPLAGPIAIVTFATSYIPFFGAFFAGAFAVLIALGAKGLSVALAMLAITLLANNTLQNLLEPVAFGRTLRLHPLTVLLVTTAGTLLFGVLGATLAAPVTAVTLRTIGLLRDAGLFGAAAIPAAAAGVPTAQDGPEASAGPQLPE
jgi:predicted PurR-regulated permease PerM